MNPQEILAILDIVRGLSYEEASQRHLTNNEDIARVAKELSKRSLLSIRGGRLEASTRQKFDLIYMALKGGASTKTVSMSLSWRDFEEFAAEIFMCHGFDVETHIVLRTPRHELDLAAWKNDLLLTADCKHWSKPLYKSSLARIIRSQVERTLHLLRVRGGERAYVLIITLQPWKTSFFRGVPIVPINQLNDFLLNFPGLTTKLLCIRTNTGGSPFSV